MESGLAEGQIDVFKPIAVLSDTNFEIWLEFEKKFASSKFDNDVFNIQGLILLVAKKFATSNLFC